MSEIKPEVNNPVPVDPKPEVNKVVEQLDKRLTRQLATNLAVCAHCGLCNESCHYYLSSGDPKMVPAYKADQLRKVYKRKYDWLGKLVPGWVGAVDVDAEHIEKLLDQAYGSCTMCRRCTLNCAMGIDMGMIMRNTRAMLTSMGHTPKGLQATVDVHLATGNNMGIEVAELVDTLEWMEEQLQSETGDPNAKIPINKKGAKALYTLNPREPKFYPLTILAAAKVMYAAGEDWTISTDSWDVTNYALFNGDDAGARKIADSLAAAAESLGVQELFMAECGHGYRAFRWESENWLGKTYTKFKVRGFVEVMADYIASKRLNLDPSLNKEPVTYHDPCNQARNGGIYREPRYILQHCVTDFREMTPSGIHNFCCGGGGGALSMTEYASRRIKSGKVKADQIAATGAKIVATSCHNCLDQLKEICRHYGIKAEIKNLCEVVADAIVWKK
jgi:Fe-S oxidoreductase